MVTFRSIWKFVGEWIPWLTAIPIAITFWITVTQHAVGQSALWSVTFASPVHSFIPTIDSGVALVGSGGDGVIVVKLDANGVIEWSRGYGTVDTDTGIHILQNSQGGYFIVGESEGPGFQRSLVLKLDSEGQLLWKKLIGDPERSHVYAAVVTADDGLLIAGSSQIPLNTHRAWVAKFNSDGAIQWQKFFDSPFGMMALGLKQLSDGNYAVCGSSGSHDSFVAKLNTSGSVLWQRLLGSAGTYETAHSIEETDQGGLIIVGRNYSNNEPRTWLVKLNSQGNYEWQKQLNNKLHDLTQNKIQRLSDGGYLLATSDINIGPVLLKIDSIFKKILWQKSYWGSGTFAVSAKPNGWILMFFSTIFGELAHLDPNGNYCGGSNNSSFRLSNAAVPVLVDQFSVTDASLSAFAPTLAAGCPTVGIPLTCGSLPTGQFNCGQLDFVFPAPGQDEKILIHKFGTWDDFPSNQTEDGIIKIQTQLKDSANQGINGIDVYIRLKTPDPDDPSPYEPDTDDNDNTGGVATLAGVNGAVDMGSGIWKVTTSTIEDSSGIAEINFQLPGFGTNTNTGPVAGDNYHFEASLSQDFSQNTADSGIITAWKKIYIENDKMFKLGGLLSFNASEGESIVTVHDWATLPYCPPDSTTPCFRVSIFDSVNTYEGNCDTAFVGWTDFGAGIIDLHLVNSDMTPYLLKNRYVSSPYPEFNSGNSAGIALLSFGTDPPNPQYYSFNEQGFADPFGRAYVMVETLPESLGSRVIPYMPPEFFDEATIGVTRILRHSKIWFQNCLSGPDEECLPNNMFHVMKVHNIRDSLISGSARVKGNAIWIYLKTIEEDLGVDCYLQFDRCASRTLIHETGHQFALNSCTYQPSHGHDERLAWCADSSIGSNNNCDLGSDEPPEKCAMSQSNTLDVANGVSEFCLKDLFDGDESCPEKGSIRRTIDPR